MRFELVILIVVAKIALIHSIMAARKKKKSLGRTEPRPVQPANAETESMEPRDVDQFLDEVLGRRPAAGGPPAPPPAKPVVILRPTQPAAPVERRLPPEMRRPAAARAPVPKPVRPSRQAKPPSERPAEAKPRSEFAQSVQKAVDQAAAATQQAAELAQTSPRTEAAGVRGGLPDIIETLRSPDGLRRAFVLREVLGPPIAMRRRRS